MARIAVNRRDPIQPTILLVGAFTSYEDMRGLIRTAKQILADPCTQRLFVDMDLVSDVSPMVAGAGLALRVTAASSGKAISFVNPHGYVREFLAREGLLSVQPRAGTVDP